MRRASTRSWPAVHDERREGRPRPGPKTRSDDLLAFSALAACDREYQTGPNGSPMSVGREWRGFCHSDQARRLDHKLGRVAPTPGRLRHMTVGPQRGDSTFHLAALTSATAQDLR